MKLQLTKKASFSTVNVVSVFAVIITFIKCKSITAELKQDLFADIKKYIVSCRGVIQLGGLVLGSPRLVPLRLRLASTSNR